MRPEEDAVWKIRRRYSLTKERKNVKVDLSDVR